MKVSELNPGQGNVEVSGTIKEISDVRTFNKFGRELRVADAMFADDSGTIKLSLWNQDTERFKEGDQVVIKNGYVGEFQGEKQLTSGKFGSIEKMGEGPASDEKSKKPAVEKSVEESSPDEGDESSEDESVEDY